ncbi:hypothetical protein L1987_49011 [Smallanthus sonchifolius]|uniref:Uncharacterized protein n=2 Tax=Smallanthus sonchifolius TaxID=185202 RepID=A0ACB9FTI3_9ASTR|nr:hypothetical protein L1987_49010 [Smallanthus sonchifolius]KAI3774455.1 hypothetical protein L1987_49011 [Smallanthus sonchifolius]
MGRAKLRMELIPKEKTRNTTYHKRKLGIIKKATEFTILCDVDTVIIIYPPNSDKPEIWPENPNKVKKIIAWYNAKKGDSGKRSYGLNDFFEDRKKKIEDELVKTRKKNMEARYSTWFDEFNALTESQLRQFAEWLENRENVVRADLEFRKRNIPVVFDQGGFGVDHHGHVMNTWGYGDVGSFVPLKREPVGFAYPVYDSGMVHAYDSVNQWGFPGPVVHGGVMQEFARMEQESLVGVSGVGEFVMNDHRGKFAGYY